MAALLWARAADEAGDYRGRSPRNSSGRWIAIRRLDHRDLDHQQPPRWLCRPTNPRHGPAKPVGGMAVPSGLLPNPRGHPRRNGAQRGGLHRSTRQCPREPVNPPERPCERSQRDGAILDDQCVTYRAPHGPDRLVLVAGTAPRAAARRRARPDGRPRRARAAMVGAVGIEPTRGRPQRCLRPSRLPFRHAPGRIRNASGPATFGNAAGPPDALVVTPEGYFGSSVFMTRSASDAYWSNWLSDAVNVAV